MTAETFKILLIEDNENDYLLTRMLLERSQAVRFDLHWVRTYPEGLAALTQGLYDCALVDHRLEAASGLDLLQAAQKQGCMIPMIMLTGQGGTTIEHEAMRLGAADYLTKDKDDPEILERVICHAIERQRAHRSLAQERQRLQTLIDNVPDCIYFKDAASRFVISNAAHLQALGVSKVEDALGKTDHDFFPPDLAARYREDEIGILATGQAQINKEELMVDARHESHWLITSKVPLHQPDGTVIGLVGISRDITALKQAQAALQKAHDELEQRVQERTAELARALADKEQEIGERKRAEARLREAEERARLIFEQAADTIFLCDPATGAIVEFNHVACQNLGYTREEFSRLRIADLEAAESPEETLRHLDVIRKAPNQVFETRHRAKDGTLRDMLVNARAIVLQGHTLVLAVCTDITGQKRVETELRDAIVKLEQHDQAQSAFVSNVSHELKTPLTSMLYGTRNLLKGVAGPLPEAAVRYLQMFDKECQRLVNTINTILDLGKMDSQNFTLSTTRLPISRLVTHCVAGLHIQAETAGIDLRLHIEKRAGFVECDPEMIERVLINVIGNAVKFTSSGGYVDVRVHPDPDNAGLVLCEVEDNGIGIPAEAMGRITQRYYRAGQHVSGAGLGLAISKETLVRHGGRLDILSPPPGKLRGTLVQIRLAAVLPPMVLAVDDEPAVLGLLEAQLTGYGYKFRRAASAGDALASLAASPPDGLILDLVLRDMHGCDLLERMKASENWRRIPVLAITGANLDEKRAEVLLHYDIPILAKPWQEAELLDRFESTMAGMRVFHQAPAPVPGEPT